MENFKMMSRFKAMVKRVPFLVSLYHFMKWDLPFLFYEGPAVVTIQGSKMFLDVKERDPSLRRTFRAYVKNKIHETVTTNIIRKILNKDETYLDLGANIGYFSLLASGIVGPGGRVFSFEPEPRNFKLLVKNRDLNDYHQMVPVNKAVADTTGRTTLYICPYDTGHHTIHQTNGITSYTTNIEYRQEQITSVEIDTVSADAFLKEQGIDHVDLIKMDVEGAELLAVRGMDGLLRGDSRVKLIMEFFPLLIEKMNGSPGELLDKFVRDYGFDIFEVADDYYSPHRKNKKILARIDAPEDLLKAYGADKMFHVNLLLLKKQDPRYGEIVNLEL